METQRSVSNQLLGIAVWKKWAIAIACFFLLGLVYQLSPSTRGAAAPAMPRSTLRAPLAKHVILVSLDGLRPDALLQAETTNLRTLWQGGAYSWHAQSVFPTATLPAHSSMISGVPVEKHGVTWNGWDPKLGYISVPTIFSIAHHAGLNTAIVAGKEKMLTLATPGAVDYFNNPSAKPSDVGRAAADYFLANHPGVLLVHFAEPDLTGHKFGWLSPAQFQIIWETDQALTPLLEAVHQSNLYDQTLIIVTTDHGGHHLIHGTDLPEDMTIPWIASGRQVKRGYQIRARVHTYDTAATVLYALGLPVPSSWDGHPLTEIFTP